jgi:hypothetical protein
MDSSLYVGRETEITEMSGHLLPLKETRKQRLLILAGNGGIGKTQLAIEYSNRHQHQYSSIFWLDADSETALKGGLCSTAQHVFEIQEFSTLDKDDLLVTRLHRWLSDTNNTNWLLIYDNYDDPDAFDIHKYFPLASHGAIIITTRRQDRVGGVEILVQTLKDLKESLRVLETRSQRKNVESGKPVQNNTGTWHYANLCCQTPMQTDWLSVSEDILSRWPRQERFYDGVR